jgi:hypothetical protein
MYISLSLSTLFFVPLLQTTIGIKNTLSKLWLCTIINLGKTKTTSQSKQVAKIRIISNNYTVKKLINGSRFQFLYNHIFKNQDNT